MVNILCSNAIAEPPQRVVGPVLSFLPLHMALASAEVKSHAHGGFCSGFA